MKIPYKYAVSLVAAIGLFMAVLDNTIVNVALAAMQRSFHTDINTIQWVITAYFLSQAAAIPAAGYLSTRFGLKRMFIVALAIFTAGSVLCGLSPHLATDGGDRLLIIFRVFQGVGGGMLFPLATSIAFGAFPPAERAASSAVIAVPVLLAPTFGPTVGGQIIDSSVGWPGIFFINIPVGLLAIALIVRVMRPHHASQGSAPGSAPAAARQPFDFVGLALSIAGTVLLVYAFTLISQTRPGTITAQNPRGDLYGLGYPLVWILVAAGLAVLAAFGLYETRATDDPVLDIGLFRTRDFLTSTVLTWAVRAVVFGSFFLLPLFLEEFRNLSALDTGLALIPQGAAATVAIITGSRLYDRIGPRALVMLGIVVLTVSSLMLMTVSKDTTGWSLAPALLVRGFGFGWSNLPLQTVALSAITGKALAKASSLYNATAQIFSSIGVALLTTLFVNGLRSHSTEIVRASGTGRPPADLAGAGRGQRRKRCLPDRGRRHGAHAAARDAAAGKEHQAAGSRRARRAGRPLRRRRTRPTSDGDGVASPRAGRGRSTCGAGARRRWPDNPAARTMMEAERTSAHWKREHLRWQTVSWRPRPRGRSRWAI